MIIFLFIINDRVNTGKWILKSLKIWGPKLIQYSQNPNKIQQFLIENINDLNYEEAKILFIKGIIFETSCLILKI